MSDFANRSKLAKLGRNRFVLLVGVLGWGVPTAILFVVLQCLQEGWDSFLVQLVIALIIFPLGGLAWGLLMWKMMERRRLRLMATGDAKTTTWRR